MLKTLPLGVQTFEKLRKDNNLYVDKTQEIHRLITTGNYFFLSRPRRSGKSLTLSTIKSIYLGQHELFKGLWIEDQRDWNKIHPVIHISFSGIGYQTIGIEAAIEAELRLIGEQQGVQFQQAGIDRLFTELIHKLADKDKVVILIDEYDKPIIDYLDNIEQAKAHQAILKIFYSVIKNCDPYIEFLLITGVSKFSKVSIFSDLNNLTDITLNRHFATLTGYTEAEVEEYFRDAIIELAEEWEQSYAELLDEIRVHYNGYSWDGKTRVYNPFSFMSFLLSGDFRNFWFETGTPAFLLKLLRDEWLYELSDLTTSEESFSTYDIENLRAIPILFQTGYLTIKEKRKWGMYTLDYPNAEVKESMLAYIIADLSHIQADFTRPMVHQLYQAFNANDVEQVIQLIKGVFKKIPSHIFLNKAEAYYHSLVYLVFFFLGQYTESEVNTNNGRLDCVIKTPTHIYILEFKLDKNADVALQQIKDRGYADKYIDNPRQKVLLGINFSSEQKTVDDWVSEMVSG